MDLEEKGGQRRLGGVGEGKEHSGCFVLEKNNFLKEVGR